MSTTLAARPDRTPKDVIIEAVQKMPDDASYCKITEEVFLLAALERASQGVEDGDFVTQAEAKERMRQWRSK